MRLRDHVYQAVRWRTYRRKLLDLRSWLATHDFVAREIDRALAILVVAPHQDDESIGCGGLIALVKSHGGTADVVFCGDGSRGFAPSAQPTDAERGALVVRRQQEARRAAAVLGVDSVTCLDGRDGQLHVEAGLAPQLARILEARRYDIVLGPWPHDGHADHRATWRSLKQALRSARPETEVWLYEVWSPLLPTIAVDISPVVDVKRRAIAVYESQCGVIDYVETALGLSRYRSVLIPGSRYAEAFLAGNRRFALRLPD
jgi:N-acetylglucosamine malate deacetylase 1